MSKPPEHNSQLMRMVGTGLLGRAVNFVAGPFVDAQILGAFQEYFPKSRLIRHARQDVLHIETRLSHVTPRFVHVTFSVVLKDPQLAELIQGMELGGYKLLVFGFTPCKVLWYPPATDFYMLDPEQWRAYRECLENEEYREVLRPDLPPVSPVD